MNFSIKPGQIAWRNMPQSYKDAYLNSPEGIEWLRKKKIRETPAVPKNKNIIYRSKEESINWRWLHE